MLRFACVVVALLVIAAAGCRRSAPLDGTPLFAPFNPRRPVAVVAARLENGAVEIAVRSLMQGRLAVRIESLAVVGGGATIDASTYECIVAGGERAHFTGGVAEEADFAAAIDLEAVGVALPLDDPGRSIYREWQRQRRPDDVAEIDAELARLDALPVCGAASDTQ